VILTQAEEADEMLLMGLRLSEGLDLANFASLTGYAPCDAAIEDLAALNLVVRTGSRLSTLPGGRPVLNEIVRRLAGALRPVTGEN
jgi:oxygen-independent coproporphyrinogen-3 oxidase